MIWTKISLFFFYRSIRWIIIGHNDFRYYVILQSHANSTFSVTTTFRYNTTISNYILSHDHTHIVLTVSWLWIWHILQSNEYFLTFDCIQWIDYYKSNWSGWISIRFLTIATDIQYISWIFPPKLSIFDLFEDDFWLNGNIWY